jgi:uncharacterized protein (DUF4415 family)
MVVIEMDALGRVPLWSTIREARRFESSMRAKPLPRCVNATWKVDTTMKPKTERENDLEEFPEPTDWSRAIQRPITPRDPGKTQISICLDNDVLDWFRDQVERAGGGSYQANINAALRAHMTSESGVRGREGFPI